MIWVFPKFFQIVRTALPNPSPKDRFQEVLCIFFRHPMQISAFMSSLELFSSLSTFDQKPGITGGITNPSATPQVMLPLQPPATAALPHASQPRLAPVPVRLWPEIFQKKKVWKSGFFGRLLCRNSSQSVASSTINPGKRWEHSSWLLSHEVYILLRSLIFKKFLLKRWYTSDRSFISQ